MIAPRITPRRGEVHDPAFKDFARKRGCILRGRHRCRGPVTFHHVREYGSPKDDTSGFALCAEAHLHVYNSKTSIEALGKVKWQRYWGVDISEEIRKVREAYGTHRSR
jgi:hypothetical protein